MTVEITNEAVDSADATRLIQALNAELVARQEEEAADTFDAGDAPPRSSFLVARAEGEAIGCGALHPLMGDIGEIKGMFVEEAARAQGVGRQLLDALEHEAKTHGYKAVWLTTERLQPEAVMLFVKSGYQSIDCYGENLGSLSKVCFKKLLD